MPDSKAEFDQPFPSTNVQEPDSIPEDDRIVFGDQQVGYVDRDGNIRLSIDDRVIGHIANDRDHAIGVLRDRYLQYVEQTRDWCDETRAAEDRLWRITDCDRRMGEFDQQFVLGSFEEIRTLLSDLKSELLKEQEERIAQRKTMIADAKQLKSSTDWKEASKAFDELNDAFKAVRTVGNREQDTLQWDQFKEHEREFRTRRSAHFEQMEREFIERAQAKERICEEAETLKDSHDFKAIGQRFREMMDEWKAIGFAGRQHDEALWQRFQGARSEFSERRKGWFAANAVKKEDLATKAEALAALEDVAAAHQQMKPLMQKWREIGSAGRNEDEALWSRFRSAQDDVYQRSRSVFEARHQERQRNFEAKQALVAEVENLVGQDSRLATNRCKEIQREWKEIGPVPRELNDRQWQQFRAACDSIFRIASAHGKRRVEDARGHAEDQIRKLSAEIDEHERKISHWEGVIAHLRDGDDADEIREAMNGKIATAKERIETKLRWIEEQHARMTDLARRL